MTVPPAAATAGPLSAQGAPCVHGSSLLPGFQLPLKLFCHAPTGSSGR